jgi:hypothetical protein
MQSCIKLCIKTTKGRVGEFKIQNSKLRGASPRFLLAARHSPSKLALCTRSAASVQNYEEEYSLPPRNDKFSASTNG